jgi:class 3 adenylate cyclase
MVDSTRITIEITNPEKIKRYYFIFINTMAAIARNFGANIIKNTGDSLIYYFPKTSDSNNSSISEFKSVIDCGLTMIGVNPIINAKLHEELFLQSLSYRISADYGRVEIAKSLTSTNEDLFGPTVSICAKINSMAQPNGMVIGSDLYQIVKPCLANEHYIFDEIGEYSVDEHKHSYPVYSVTNKDKIDNDDAINLYKSAVS